MNISCDQFIELLMHLILIIPTKLNNPKEKIACSVGIDYTVIISGFQVSSTHHSIICGNSPNHIIPIEDKGEDETCEILMECAMGKFGQNAD